MDIDDLYTLRELLEDFISKYNKDSNKWTEYDEVLEAINEELDNLEA